MLPYYIRSLIPSRPLSPLPIRSVLPPRAHSVRADGLSPIFIDIASSSSRRLQSLALLSGAIAGTLVRKIAGRLLAWNLQEHYTATLPSFARPPPAFPTSGWLTLYSGAGRPSDCLCIAGYKCVPEEFASVRAMGGRWDVLSHEAAVGARQPGRANTWTNLGRQCSLSLSNPVTFHASHTFVEWLKEPKLCNDCSMLISLRGHLASCRISIKV